MERIISILSLFLIYLLTLQTNSVLCKLEKYETFNTPACKIQTGDKSINIFNTTWEIDLNKSSSIKLEFCSNHQNISLASIQQSNTIFADISLGRKIKIIENGIEFIDGDFCTKTIRYSLKLELECSNTTPKKPTINQIEKCTFLGKMRTINCEPKCTNFLDTQHLIDLRELLSNNKLFVADDFGNFSFNLCGESNSDCKNTDLNACLIRNEQVIGLSQVGSENVYYDVKKDLLVIRGDVKNQKHKIIKSYDLKLICNFDTEFSNLKHIKLQTQGKNYHFIAESNLACIQLPQNCQANSFDNTIYDLSPLYKQNWQVKNVLIDVNICGQQRVDHFGDCLKQNAQICKINGEKSINLGSVLLPLEVDNDLIIAKFIHGSKCDLNGGSYCTRVEFVCNREEMGPILKQQSKCEIVLEWKTPHACPVTHFVTDKCEIVDKLGYRNLQSLYTSTDKTINLGTNTQLFYNLCGSLHKSCNNQTSGVSFCLITNNIEKIIGYTTTELNSEMGLLSQNYIGDLCTIKVDFKCSYLNLAPKIKIPYKSCNIQLEFYTELACITKNKFEACHVTDENTVYNLNDLILKNKNYEVRTQNKSIFFNICGPVVTQSDVLCDENTMVCLRNNDEANIKYRFHSIGTLNGKGLIVENGSLLYRSEIGNLCDEFRYFKTNIIFQCSQIEEKPQLQSEINCTFTIIWKTQFACPAIPQLCLLNYTNASNKSALNLYLLDENIIKINLDGEYQFDLCDNFFTHLKNNVTEQYKLTRLLSLTNGTTILKLIVTDDHFNGTIKTVIVEMHCIPLKSSTNYRKLKLDGGILYLLYETNIVCNNDVQIIYKQENKIEKIEITTKKEYKMEKEIPNKNLENKIEKEYKVRKDIININQKHKNTLNSSCLVPSLVNGKGFNINRIPFEKVQVNGSFYKINFIGLNKCDGFLCKNDIKVIGSSLYCPIPHYFNDNMTVLLNYSSETKCKLKNETYQVQISIKCDTNENVQSKIFESGLCIINIINFNADICLLFPTNSHSNIALIVCLVILVIFLIIIAIGIYLYKFGRFRRFRYYGLLDSSSRNNLQNYIADKSL